MPSLDLSQLVMSQRAGPITVYSGPAATLHQGPLREASDSPPFPLSSPCEGRRGIDMAFISPVTSHFLIQSQCNGKLKPEEVEKAAG